MPELLNAPENRFEMTKLEEKKMFLGSSDDPNQPVFDPKKPVFVNPKQYHRILERRKTRLRQKANGILAMLGKDNMQESRHNHANNRERMEDGWVLNEEEQEKEEEDDVTVLEDSDEGNEDQEAEPYMSMPLRKIRPDPMKKSFKRKPKPDPHLVRWAHLLKPVPLRSVPVPPSGTPLGKDAALPRYRPSPVVTRIPPMAARSSNRPIAPVGGGQPPVERTMFPLRQPPGSSALSAPSGTSTTTPTEPASTSNDSNPRASSESLSEAQIKNPEATPLLDHSRLLLTRIGNAPKEYPTPVSVFIPHLPVGASTNPPAAPKTPKTPKSKPPALVGQPEPADRPKGPSGSNAAPYCPQGRWAQFSSEAQEKKSDPAPGISDPTSSTPGSSNPSEVAPAESTDPLAASTPRTIAPKPLHRPAPGNVPPPYQPQRQWANLKSSTPGTSKPSVPRPKGPVSLPATSTPGAASSQTVSRSTPKAAGSSTPGAASTSSSPAVPRPRLTSQRVPSSSTSSADSEPPGYREQVRSVQMRLLSPYVKNFPHRPPMQQSAPNVIRPQVYCKETAPRLEQRNQTIRVRTTKGRIASMSPAQYEQCKARMLAAKREKEKAAEKNAVEKGEEQQSEDIAIEKEVEKQAEKELEKGIAAEKTVVEKEAEKTVLEREVEEKLHKEKAQENDIVEKETEKQ
ncbi:hypothetical protein CAEBREN_21374 [Caenorhabditis brenneri]|uniref:Nuclear transcription factor Y subunit n=1 Tax=Caenorhabditis brenneri TaxID=135651 RepID=G0NFS3_CAEBE|nr:hypothetical protein CAEBREN_21374 [Caenorhabditis brenneri]